MTSLIFLLVFGSSIAFLSMQNTTQVAITFLNYTSPALPLFYVIIGSMLIGILLSYIIHLSHSISTALTIRSKNKKLKDKRKEVVDLTKRLHQLELENVKLKKENLSEDFDEKSL